ncbi:MAG TPA: 50S ribosomal protein L15 [Thermomicrobiales bacterium]|nr:50S ribosomal protein L15 [Thermomicrobiales bacterium]
MQQHDLRPNPGARRPKRRVGRGTGSGTGKTAGRGTKGQKARETVRRGFEGGQLPIQKRMPYKRGFVNPFRVEYEIVNVGRLEELVADERLDTTIDPTALAHAGAIDLARPLKILGDGELTRPLAVRAHKVTAGARAKIEAAGGTIELLDEVRSTNDGDGDSDGDTA